MTCGLGQLSLASLLRGRSIEYTTLDWPVLHDIDDVVGIKVCSRTG